MRLNLGCGDKLLKNYHNVDLYAEDADEKADIRHMNRDRESVSEVLAVHVIEHMSRYDGCRLIHRAARWLQLGGELIIETPDREKCLKLCQTGDKKKWLMGAKGFMGGRSGTPDFKKSWHDWLLKNRVMDYRYAVPKKYRIPGESHVYVWTGEELQEEMEAAGLDAVVESPQFHGRRKTRDTRVVGRK